MVYTLDVISKMEETIETSAMKLSPASKADGRLRVAIQGISASFHEIAAFAYFGREIETVECLSFHSLCETLSNHQSDFAVMAIENSIAGSILPNYFLLQQYRFRIIGELYLPIHMHLLSLSGVSIDDIRCVESHTMAIRQCTDFINRLENVEIHESDDTALSAKRISEEMLKDTAAIANEFAAKKYGLQILARNIENHKKNFTRFLILSNQVETVPGSNKASMSFVVANRVGSLAEALIVFKSNHINLTKIQSIPIIGKPNEYSIHVDVEWDHRDNYDTAMGIIRQTVTNLNLLGEYRKGSIVYS